METILAYYLWEKSEVSIVELSASSKEEMRLRLEREVIDLWNRIHGEDEGQFYPDGKSFAELAHWYLKKEEDYLFESIKVLEKEPELFPSATSPWGKYWTKAFCRCLDKSPSFRRYIDYCRTTLLQELYGSEPEV